MAEVRAEFPREYTITIHPGSTIGGIVQDEQGDTDRRRCLTVGLFFYGQRGDGKLQVDLQNFRTQTDANGCWRDVVPAVL